MNVSELPTACQCSDMPRYAKALEHAVPTLYEALGAIPWL